MSDEQSIRDEIADEIAGVVTGKGYYSMVIGIDAAHEAADQILASPVIRRIQAEALREAADSIERRRNEPGLVKLDVQCAGYYTGIRSGMESSVKALRSEADRIERGETA